MSTFRWLLYFLFFLCIGGIAFRVDTPSLPSCESCFLYSFPMFTLNKDELCLESALKANKDAAPGMQTLLWIALLESFTPFPCPGGKCTSPSPKDVSISDLGNRQWMEKRKRTSMRIWSRTFLHVGANRFYEALEYWAKASAFHLGSL